MTGLAVRLEGQLLEWGAALVGFADVAGLPEDVRPTLPRAVVFGVALDPGIVQRIRNGPTAEYQAHYQDVNRRLSELADQTARFLEEAGAKAEALEPTVDDLADLGPSMTAPFSHKMAATRAGLAWIGKCALAITPQFGPALRFATVLTDAELPVGVPIEASQCGDCDACVAICPGNAPSGAHWDATMHRDDFFDAQACRDTTRKYHLEMGHHICGMCIAACPYTSA